MIKWLGFLCIALSLLACSPRVPSTPPSARDQTPGAALPGPWIARGRLEVVAPGKRMSGTAIIRAMPDGSVRAAFLSDEGLLLSELTATNGTFTITKTIPDMERAAPYVGRLVAQGFGVISDVDRIWKDDVLVATHRDAQRWYGGDPLLLRAVTGDGFDIYIENYRPFDGMWMAREARAEGPFGITIRLNLQSIQRPTSKP